MIPILLNWKPTLTALLTGLAVFLLMWKAKCGGLEWGRLFEAYHTTPYDPAAVSAKVHELYADGAVKKRAGIFEYIFRWLYRPPDCLKFVCLKKVQRRPFTRSKQTQPKECGKSNCPLCALGTDNNAKRIYKFSEMDADHVTAWSNGGATDISNCQMLCKTHNRGQGQ